MSKELAQSLLEAGVHFGHQTKKWNPKMKPYIYGEKNGIYIIDLEKTMEALKRACNFIREVAASGAPVLYVGTKPQAQPIIEEEAKKCGMYYVRHRWLGGMLTNYATIRNSVRRYKSLIQMREDGTFEALKKKEVADLEKEIVRLEKNLSGVASMEKLPGALIVVDAKHEEIAIKEANRLSIPVIAIVDTDSDPGSVAYPIPGNDDAIRSVKLLLSVLTGSLMEGLQNVSRTRPIQKDKDEEEVVETMAAETEGKE